MIIKSKVIAFSIATLLAELAEIKEQNEQLQSTVATLQLEKSILSTSIEVRQVQEPTLLGVSIHNNGWLQNVSGLVAQEVAAELEGFDGVGSQVETKKLSVILKVVNSRLEELFGFPFSAINVVQLFPKKQTAIPLHRELFGSFPNNLFSTDQEEKIGSTYLKAIEMLSQDPSQVIVLPTPDLLITASKILKISTSELEGRLAQSDDHIEGLPGPLYKALKEGSRANLRILFMNEQHPYMLILSKTEIFEANNLDQAKYEYLSNLILYLKPIIIAQHTVKRITMELEEDQRLLSNMLTAVISRLAELKDNETQLHTCRVGLMTQLIVDELINTNFEGVSFHKSQVDTLSGIPKSFFETLQPTHQYEKRVMYLFRKRRAAIASMLHDIGKIGIPDDILLHPGKLQHEAWEIMQRHVGIGSDILRETIKEHPEIKKRKMLFFDLLMTLSVVEQHHEKWDGSGYPQALVKEQSSLIARITAIVDVYDALRSIRPYKKSKSAEIAKHIIKQGSGTHFDPALVDIFLRLFDKMESVQKENQDDMVLSEDDESDNLKNVLYRLTNLMEFLPKIDQDILAMEPEKARSYIQKLTGRRYSEDIISIFQRLVELTAD